MGMNEIQVISAPGLSMHDPAVEGSKEGTDDVVPAVYRLRCPLPSPPIWDDEI